VSATTITKPETLTAVCAKHYTANASQASMGNTPTNCNTGNGFRVDDHK